MGSLVSRIIYGVIDAIVSRITGVISPPDDAISLIDGDTEPGEDNVKKDVLDRFLAKAEPVDDCTCRTDMPPNTDSFVMCPNKGYFCRVKRGSLPWLAETWREVAGVMGDAENGQVPSGEEGWTTADKSKPVRKLSGLVRAESLPAMSLSNQAGGTEEDSNYHRAVSAP